MNVSKTIADYKRAIKARDSATNKRAGATAEKTIADIRQKWKDWEGDANSLDEVAFGG